MIREIGDVDATLQIIYSIDSAAGVSPSFPLPLPGAGGVIVNFLKDVHEASSFAFRTDYELGYTIGSSVEGYSFDVFFPNERPTE